MQVGRPVPTNILVYQWWSSGKLEQRKENQYEQSSLSGSEAAYFQGVVVIGAKIHAGAVKV